jgi:hypothetical protein
VIDKHLLDEEISIAVDYDYWLRIAREFQFGHINKILSADRYYSGRRMLTEAETIQEEEILLQNKYGADLIFFGKFLNQVDRIVTGSFRRILGLVKLIQISQQNNIAFPLTIGNMRTVIFRQINPMGGYQMLLKDLEG